VSDMIVLIKMKSHAAGLKQAPINSLTLNMFKADGKRPRLKTKAAETRNLVPVTLLILEMFGLSSTHAQTRYECLKCLNEIYKEMEGWNDHSGARIAELARKHCILYSALGEEACRNSGDWMFWRMSPKHHMMIHLCEDQLEATGNPRFHWCYRDESEIGLAVEVAESGGNPKTLNMHIMMKYRTWHLEASA